MTTLLEKQKIDKKEIVKNWIQNYVFLDSQRETSFADRYDSYTHFSNQNGFIKESKKSFSLLFRGYIERANKGKQI